MHVETITDGVHRIADGIVNCYVLEEAGEVTLVDALFPGSFPALVQALSQVSRTPSDIRAVVLTHGHVDHIGTAERLRREQQIPVRAHADELDLLRGQRARGTPTGLTMQLLPQVWRPQTWRFVAHGMRHGFMAPEWLSQVQTVDDGEKLDVPGHPVAVFTPGHTAGHLAFHLADVGAVLSGDALATFDILTGRVGPRIESLTEDPGLAYRSLDRFAELPADLLLPGHGNPWRGSMETAAELARAVAEGRQS